MATTLGACPAYITLQGCFKIHLHDCNKASYDFADDLIVKLYSGLDETSLDETTNSISEIKSYLTRIGAENLPSSGRLLNELLLKEATRRFFTKHVKVIQTQWRSAIADPKKEVCIRRLFREFTMLRDFM